MRPLLARRHRLRFPQHAGIGDGHAEPVRRDHGPGGHARRAQLDLVWFTEHHFLDDGYLPSWVPMAGAIVARTKRVRLSSDVFLLPFNHPVRLAEDLAVLDNISNGRIEVGVGMGYAPHEFRGFGLPVSRRVSLTDEGIEVLRHCFAGGSISWQALRFRRRGDQAALRAIGWPAALDRCDVGTRRAAPSTQ